MRHTLIAAAVLITAVAATADERSRTFSSRQDASGVTEVVLRGGVGEVEILGVPGSEVEVTATATADSSSFFGSARARRILEEARLVAEVRGSTLELRIEMADDDDHEFGEEWTVRMPAALDARLKFGVGDIRVVDVAGDIRLEVGVGDIRIEGGWESFGPIEATCGVGDVTLRTPQGREDGSGFISRSLDARGPGRSSLSIRAGVGDVTIKLR